MPRLGTAAEDEDPETEGRQRRQFPSVGSARPPTSHHHMATAYAYGSSTILHNNNNSPLARLGMLLLIVVLTIILRNVLFHDYREDVIETLQASGQLSVEEIDRIVPKTAQERQQYALNEKNDLMQMKHDIAYLLQQVQELKEQIKQQQPQPSNQSGTKKTGQSSSTDEQRKESKGTS